jgi:hypothetical protein
MIKTLVRPIGITGLLHVGARRRWKNDIKIHVEKYLNCVHPAQNIIK